MSASVKFDSTHRIFLALIWSTIVWAESNCRVFQENGTAVRPKVRPFSATKMQVFWTDVFENCTGEETVKVRYQTGHTPWNLVWTELGRAKLNQYNITFDGNPCKPHQINVEVFIPLETNNIKSSVNDYNNPNSDPHEYFGGYLKEELSNVCPIKSKSEQIPLALRDCVKFHNWTQTSEHIEMFVKIKEPKKTSVRFTFNPCSLNTSSVTPGT